MIHRCDTNVCCAGFTSLLGSGPFLQPPEPNRRRLSPLGSGQNSLRWEFLCLFLLREGFRSAPGRTWFRTSGRTFPTGERSSQSFRVRHQVLSARTEKVQTRVEKLFLPRASPRSVHHRARCHRDGSASIAGWVRVNWSERPLVPLINLGACCLHVRVAPSARGARDVVNGTWSATGFTRWNLSTFDSSA